MDFLNDDIEVKYVADGARTEFGFAFKVFAASDVEVRVDGGVVSSGIEVSPAPGGLGGRVRFFAAPVAGCTITLFRRLGLGRVSTFQTGGLFRAEDLNRELDYQRACVRQIDSDLSFSLKVCSADAPVDTRLPPARPGAALVWNSDGTGLVNQDVDISEQVGFVEDCANTVERVYNDLTEMLGNDPSVALVGIVNNILGVLREKFPDVYFDGDGQGQGG